MCKTVQSHHIHHNPNQVWTASYLLDRLASFLNDFAIVEYSKHSADWWPMLRAWDSCRGAAVPKSDHMERTLHHSRGACSIHSGERSSPAEAFSASATSLLRCFQSWWMRLLLRRWSWQNQACCKIYPGSLSSEEASCAGIGGDNDQSRPCCTCWSLAHRYSYWSSPSGSWSASAWPRFGQRPHYHAWILQPFLSIWTSIGHWWTLFLWQRGIWTGTCYCCLISFLLRSLLKPLSSQQQ